MSAMMRAVLVRISPVFWLAAITLAAVHVADRNLYYPAFIMISAALGASGQISGAIEATDKAGTEMLVRTLADVSQQRAGELRPHLRRAR